MKKFSMRKKYQITFINFFMPFPQTHRDSKGGRLIRFQDASKFCFCYINWSRDDSGVANINKDLLRCYHILSFYTEA